MGGGASLIPQLDGKGEVKDQDQQPPLPHTEMHNYSLEEYPATATPVHVQCAPQKVGLLKKIKFIAQICIKSDPNTS